MAPEGRIIKVPRSVLKKRTNTSTIASNPPLPMSESLNRHFELLSLHPESNHTAINNSKKRKTLQSTEARAKEPEQPTKRHRCKHVGVNTAFYGSLWTNDDPLRAEHSITPETPSAEDGDQAVDSDTALRGNFPKDISNEGDDTEPGENGDEYHESKISDVTSPHKLHKGPVLPSVN
ncbi:hypothetical protein K402DRAFT_419639 [Aulographum hederae CBS 113979]|uniref:Uncharacterized protein n=1 Tax=Aulographum hederae CBS 113979 TaxID=1176131 RepID=A0A6G1H509_9PEZI|nr:hypothetical protein K402DRAFT_419639 [Aulographum hederae CBS 113979]